MVFPPLAFAGPEKMYIFDCFKHQQEHCSFGFMIMARVWGYLYFCLQVSPDELLSKLLKGGYIGGYIWEYYKAY